MEELKLNDPVMWEKREYRFVRYPVGSADEAVIVTVGKTNRHWFTIPVSELSLIMEFDFVKE
jgi:hypothetical protein|tara:strand:- start:178 stop:363 length:186 start_codon:yes stop_codon:yes gene_type:complete